MIVNLFGGLGSRNPLGQQQGPGGVEGLDPFVELVKLEVSEDVVPLLPPGDAQLVQ